MANITAIEKVTGGWEYTLATAPAGGWDIFLDGQLIDRAITDTAYTYRTKQSWPPPIEVVNPGERMDMFINSPSMVAGNTISLEWPNADTTHYLIEYSENGSDWATLIEYAYSGGIRQKIIRVDISEDAQRLYKVTPGTITDDVFYAQGEPVTVTTRRASIQKPLLASYTYNATTHVISVTGEERGEL